MTETSITLPGLRRNPHISGDWVSFEDATSAGLSSIDLYYIPTGQVFTSNAAGNNDIYVYRFTFAPIDPPLTVTRIAAGSSGLNAAAGVTFTDADPNGHLAQYSGKIDWGDGTPPSPALVFKNRYASPGTYTVTVTVNDVEGATASRTTTLTVRADD